MNTRRGFTLTDLVVLLGIFALLLAMVIRSTGNASEVHDRVRCGSNLRQIGQAILLYSNENKGSYPRTLYNSAAPVTQYTGVNAATFFAPGGPANNDVTAALFLLLRTQDITSEVFICPATNLQPLKTNSLATLSNFSGNQNLAYSYANPYPSTTAVNAGYRMNSTVGAEFAVAADMNPGGPGLTSLTIQSQMAQMRQGNTKNHGGAGENVLYGDGHVEWQLNPFCGQKRDNIYTVSGSTDGFNETSTTISASPKWAGDSVLLPVATIDPGYVSPQQTMMYIVLGVTVVGAIVGLILWLTLRNKKPAPVPQWGQMAPPPVPPQQLK